MITINRLFCLALLSVSSAYCFAQEENGKKITVSGSIQSDILIPQDDDKIGTEKTNDWALTNTYADVSVMSKHIDAGARFEFLKHPLPGFENDFKGWGVPNIYLKAHFKNWNLTLGNFYEQFGSGFILRTYEERSLGVDNSLLGGRLVINPLPGVTIKALSGKQRRYWSYNDAWVSGGDIELGLDQWFKTMSEHNTYLTLGASWVNKYESEEDIMTDATHKLNLPTYVNAFDIRANLQKGDFNLLAEYAWKTQDPSFDNGYIYRKGNVAMLSASYSKRGMSILLQAKRSDNMSFRSRRTITGTSSFINHMPAFTMEHTYALAAMYPYATNPDGEWAFQGEFGYKFKRHTALGGKYGTNVKLNFSHVRGIDTNYIGGAGTDGYGSAFWKMGDETFYQDLNVQIEKKITRQFKLNLMYMNQFYNKTIVEGEGGMIHSDIFVADGKYQFNNKFTLRGELQYLSTDDDLGDWWYGLLELSVLPNWMFTISDEYNSGVTNLHYYQGYITFNKGSHRLQLGYGRTRAGFNCSGGVCRYVPASKGVTLSYNYNF
ncbi:putative uncharacterized protein [Prevotella sp. CAG:924]|nr:putative uncharacterized protein [Prevotella sp. CAG:924]